MKQEPHEVIITAYEANAGRLIKQLFKNEEERASVLNEILHGGPPHKQVLSCLLLSSLSDLVFSRQKQTGKKFKLQPGLVITAGKAGEQLLPVAYVDSGNDKGLYEQIAATVEKAPVHESIVYLITLQAINWLNDKL